MHFHFLQQVDHSSCHMIGDIIIIIITALQWPALKGMYRALCVMQFIYTSKVYMTCIQLLSATIYVSSAHNYTVIILHVPIHTIICMHD